MTIFRPGDNTRVAVDRADTARIGIVRGAVRIVGSPSVSCVEVAGLAHAPLRIEQADGELAIGYRRRVRRLPAPLSLLSLLRRTRADLTVTIPPDAPVHVVAVDATISVHGMAAPVRIDTVRGSVTLVRLDAGAAVHALRAAVNATRVSGDLKISLHAGDFTLASCRSGRVQATSVHGSHLVDLADSDAHEVDLHCRVGDIIVRIPSNADLAVQALAQRGEVACQVPQLELVRRRTGGNVWGTLGLGTARLAARTDNGRLTILSSGLPSGVEPE